MKWLSEHNAFIKVEPYFMHEEDMQVSVDCENDGYFYVWADIIPSYKKLTMGLPLQETLRKAERAFNKTMEKINGRNVQ